MLSVGFNNQLACGTILILFNNNYIKIFVMESTEVIKKVLQQINKKVQIIVLNTITNLKNIYLVIIII